MAERMAPGAWKRGGRAGAAVVGAAFDGGGGGRDGPPGSKIQPARKFQPLREAARVPR